MPALTTRNATILVSGANGFVGSWVANALLERGYNVRAAVRTEEKGFYLLDQFKSYGSRFQVIAVGDIAKENAFEEAVKDVEGIVHTASPVHTICKDPREMIEPAVSGIIGMLTCALKFGKSVQRVVFTSSCAAIFGVDETGWNDAAVLECEHEGQNAIPFQMYAASKTLSERRAWEFVTKHASELKWDFTVINPPWIFGPPIHEVTSPEHLNNSNRCWYKAVIKGNYYFGRDPKADPEVDPGHGWIDIRDVAEAHVRALETPAAGGERIIVSAESPWVWQDFRDVSRGLQPKPRTKGVRLDTSKEQRIFGLQRFKTMQESTEDLLAYISSKGWGLDGIHLPSNL
ncbi:hypothetical protein GYMLUDRAFT_239777 [Collybiopsis luxurians FD-317 M1]|nr:hypothetical protein GYMLUDRAFT_239777 [Collybiopsis luxurians FD-317 M1]